MAGAHLEGLTLHTRVAVAYSHRYSETQHPKEEGWGKAGAHLEGFKLHIRVAVGDSHGHDTGHAVGPQLILHGRHLAHLGRRQNEVPLLNALREDPADLLQPAASAGFTVSRIWQPMAALRGDKPKAWQSTVLGRRLHGLKPEHGWG